MWTMQRSWLVPLLVVVSGAPAVAQNNGLPGQQQSVVLVELIADRGLLKSWQAASLRMQTRDQLGRFDDAGRTAVAAEIEAQRPTMGCDHATLTTWIEGAGPNLEREYLPELLAGYRAFALQAAPPAAFREATRRKDYADAIARIDAKLAALQAAGVQPPGRMTWAALADRQRALAAQIAAAISGNADAGRFSPAQATQITQDVAQIGELWLAEP
jgi:hypothetical protein